MFNQRGQAFSVFQLLIAAIVAVAILGVLFSVMGGINVGVTGDPKTAIGNALAGVKNGGQTMSQEFTLKNGDFITSNDFEEKGFEASMIMFGLGTFDGTNGFEADVEGDEIDGFSYIKYTGATPRTVKTSVICQSTDTRLSGVITTMDLDSQISKGMCYGSGDDSIQPCCAVILRRS
jgi:hypothetical protein